MGHIRPHGLLTAVVLLAVACSACGGGFARRGAEPIPQGTPTSVGGGLEDPQPQPVNEAPVGSGEGELILTVVDHNGNNPAGIPVQIGGAQETTVRSDVDGRVILRGPAGYYTYKVPVGCDGDVEVRQGRTGRIRVSPGETATAEVEASWRRRFGPYPPAFSTEGPGWPSGEVINVRFDVVDRCTQARVGNQDLSAYTLKESASLAVVSGTPLRSDGAGYGTVRVRCTRAGDASLVVSDPRNPQDTIDLVRHIASYDQRPYCA